jgi:hypothetical protein
LLTDGQKENRVSISQEVLANADADENSMKTWIQPTFFYSPH